LPARRPGGLRVSRSESYSSWRSKERFRNLKQAWEAEQHRRSYTVTSRGGLGPVSREKIAEMPPADRRMAERIHAIVKEAAPEPVPRTWYGMPAYAKEGKAICFFKAASKYKERYAAFGFDIAANLEEGTMWPSGWFLTKLTAADEKLIAALVKKAVT
jgi:hypothetical protein